MAEGKLVLGNIEAFSSPKHFWTNTKPKQKLLFQPQEPKLQWQINIESHYFFSFPVYVHSHLLMGLLAWKQNKTGKTSWNLTSFLYFFYRILPIFIKCVLFLCMNLWEPHACLMNSETMKGRQNRIGVTDYVLAPHGLWELNLSLLEEH